MQHMTGAANATKCGLAEWRTWCSEQRHQKGDQKFRVWFDAYNASEPPRPKVRRNPVVSRPYPARIDWSKAKPHKWREVGAEFDGTMSFRLQPETEEREGPIAAGVALCKSHPELYEAMYYQSDMCNWPEEQQAYTLVKRWTKAGVHITSEPGAGFTWFCMVYQVTHTLTLMAVCMRCCAC